MSELQTDDKTVDLLAFVDNPHAPEFAAFRRSFAEYLAQSPKHRDWLLKPSATSRTTANDGSEDQLWAEGFPQEADEAEQVALPVGEHCQETRPPHVAGLVALTVVALVLVARRVCATRIGGKLIGGGVRSWVKRRLHIGQHAPV